VVTARAIAGEYSQDVTMAGHRVEDTGLPSPVHVLPEQMSDRE
jgi:hypothetical protein